MAKITKGFIKNWGGDTLLPITRAELVLDSLGQVAFSSGEFEAGKNGSKYGLISVDDLAKIKSTSGSGLSLQDVYDKLGYVNSGIYINNKPFTFYGTNGVKTPINVSAVENTVVLGVGENTLTLDLAKVGKATTTTKFIKGLTVDDYGRVTTIVEGDLDDSEIPATLTNKTLVNGILDGCYTKDTEIANNDKAVVNKYYVDQAVAKAAGIATGALTFGTVLSTLEDAKGVLKDDYLNHYFKVSGKYSINVSDLYDSNKYSETTIDVKPGDTLIVYKDSSVTSAKFIHIPSGDDVTTITVARESDLNPVIQYRTDDVKFTFSDVFSVSNPNGGGNVLIKLPKATNSVDGYLSSEDFARFNNYENSLAVSYSSIFTASDGYKLGTITVGENTYDIYGKNQVSKLELTNGETNAYNPILKFTETGVDPVSITVKGIKGITAFKDGNTIEIGAANEVDADSQSYLEITDGYKFGVKLGSVESGQVTPGLTDYGEFAEFRSLVYSNGTIWEEVATLEYGSSGLIAAISF